MSTDNEDTDAEGERGWVLRPPTQNHWSTAFLFQQMLYDVVSWFGFSWRTIRENTEEGTVIH